ncbi:hypothetical protein B296_00020719 [Ensete ventricosum]|uniref:Uncharacterized protein n=1 Tax=Ensete ventricosum TaxID=4639 RepID=A0A426ZIC9_ENSVE|nr:hypothetical protein B296_00020719 [Ensete ventricosum]
MLECFIYALLLFNWGCYVALHVWGRSSKHSDIRGGHETWSNIGRYPNCTGDAICPFRIGRQRNISSSFRTATTCSTANIVPLIGEQVRPSLPSSVPYQNKVASGPRRNYF